MTQRVTAHLKLEERREGPVWLIKSRVPGRKPQQTTRRLGPAWLRGGAPPADHFTRKAAQEALEAFLVDERIKVAEGFYELVQEVGHPAVVTFEDGAREFLRFIVEERQRDPSTVADYRGVIDGYLIPEFGEQPLDAVTPDMIDAYKLRLLKRKDDKGNRTLSNRTIVRHLTVLHGIFKRAQRKWQLSYEPGRGRTRRAPAGHVHGRVRHV